MRPSTTSPRSAWTTSARTRRRSRPTRWRGSRRSAGLTVLGPQRADQRGGAISFEIDGIHPHDISQVLDSRGIAVRAGHHCAKPAHRRFGVQSSTRMSSYLYTTPAEIDALVEGLEYTKKYFRVG